jgi:hypothetical protein
MKPAVVAVGRAIACGVAGLAVASFFGTYSITDPGLFPPVPTPAPSVRLGGGTTGPPQETIFIDPPFLQTVMWGLHVDTAGWLAGQQYTQEYLENFLNVSNWFSLSPLIRDNFDYGLSTRVNADVLLSNLFSDSADCDQSYLPGGLNYRFCTRAGRVWSTNPFYVTTGAVGWEGGILYGDTTIGFQPE